LYGAEYRHGQRHKTEEGASLTLVSNTLCFRSPLRTVDIDFPCLSFASSLFSLLCPFSLEQKTRLKVNLSLMIGNILLHEFEVLPLLK
jgi:hypothetical protein